MTKTKQWDCIPKALREHKAWLLWKSIKYKGDKKPRKVPVYLNGQNRKGTQGSEEDRKNLATFDQVVQKFELGGYTGIGIAMLPEWGLAGLDFDNCVHDGVVDEGVLKLVQNTYAEISPSGNGVRGFMLGQIDDNKSYTNENEFGFETFCAKGFLTVTGDVLDSCYLTGEYEELEALTGDVQALCAARFSSSKTKTSDSDCFSYVPKIGLSEDELIKLLYERDPDMDYHEWLEIGMALHHETGGSEVGLEIWDKWSASSWKYEAYAVKSKYKSFGKNSKKQVTARSLLRNAKIATVLNPRDFMGMAQTFLDLYFSNKENNNLIRFDGFWYEYSGSHYERLAEDALNAYLWNWLSKCQKLDKDKNQVPFSPTTHQISSIIEAIKAKVFKGDLKPPVWLDRSTNDAIDYVSLENGLLHIPTKSLQQNTYKYFTLNSLPYEWKKYEEPKKWLTFLDQIFSNDLESINALQEIFGYLLTADNSQQKIFLIKGAKRSGKGTIGRVLAELIGQDNVASPALGDLSSSFGLQPIIGKLLGLIPDARIDRKTSKAPIVERLLMVSGGDKVTIDRKHMTAWSGTLSVRFLILTNELPYLKDVSGALASRFIILTTKSSFYGREDINLTKDLLEELPYILHWALEGKDRLAQRGCFVQPVSAQIELDQLNELNSPVMAFVNTCCDIGLNYRVSKDDLYNKFCNHLQSNGYNFSPNKLSFGKELKDALPTVEDVRPGVGNSRPRFYKGIRIKPELVPKIEKDETLNDSLWS
jgi:P4 family phage/plasmid primase-like protien